MFDIGLPELLLVAAVALIVIGPDRLPEVLRTFGLWFGRMRRSFLSVKTEIEREIGMDEVRRQLHNEAVMEEMKRIEKEVKKSAAVPSILPPKTARPAATSPAETPAAAPDRAAATPDAPPEDPERKASDG